MVLLDYCIIAVLVLSILISIIRGFVREILSCINFILSIIFSQYYYTIFQNYLKNTIQINITPKISIGTLFIFILFIGSVINYFIMLLFDKIVIKIIDKILGLLFGLIRGFFLIIFLISFFIKKVDQVFELKYLKNSFFIPYIIEYYNFFIKIFQDLNIFLL